MATSYFEKLSGKNVVCHLCPRECELKRGATGYCRVRTNIDGELVNEAQRLFSGIGFDPVEKKPLYHFYPGKAILSVGGIGCNMHCQWCQNCEISQAGISGSERLASYTPQQLLDLATRNDQNIGIAFTYNEPTINFETYIEIAELFKRNNYKCVLVTNGYISKEPLAEYLKYIDAFNVDVKAFDADIHKRYTGARLEPILENLETILHSGKHLELTYLIVPGVNSDIAVFCEFIEWVASHLGAIVPLHISRYFPRYKFTAEATPESVLEEFCLAARKKLDYVYAGNTHLSDFENTICPTCKTLIVKRRGFYSQIEEQSTNGNCSVCGTKIFRGL
jgi:pyruvate formate lyase activating enzyme